MEKCFMSTLHPSLDVPIVCTEKCIIKSKLDYTKSNANLVKSRVGILMCNVDLHEVQSTYDKVRCGSSKVQS
jgi:hypothetical protein